MLNNVTYKKLGEVGQVITGNTPSTKEEKNYASKDVCFFKPSDFNASSLNLLDKAEYFISRYAYEHSRRLPKDSVLTTCIGIIGKVGILAQEATCNQQINAIIPNRDVIIPRYLGYSLLAIKDILVNAANAPIVPLLNKSQFSAISIPVYTIDDQQRIVRELDAIHAILDAKNEQLCELDKLAEAIFYEMFGDPISNEKGWNVKKIGEVATIIGGSTPRTSEPSNWIGTNAWVTPAELKGDKYMAKTERTISDEAASHLELMPVGTVLLSSRAPIGKLAITRIPMYCNQGFKNVVCGELLNNEFTYWYLLLNVPRLQELGVGATFKEVSKSAVQKFGIILPPLDLQQAFASKISAIEQQKERIRLSLRETETLLAARMQHYFD